MVLLVSGIVSFIMSRNAIEDKIFNQMTSLREIKGQQIESYINRISQQIVTLSDNPATYRRDVDTKKCVSQGVRV